MVGWLNGDTEGFINLSIVVRAQVFGTAGAVRFFFQDGTYAQVAMGTNDTTASESLTRLLDAVEPSTYF